MCMILQALFCRPFQLLLVSSSGVSLHEMTGARCLSWAIWKDMLVYYITGVLSGVLRTSYKYKVDCHVRFGGMTQLFMNSNFIVPLSEGPQLLGSVAGSFDSGNWLSLVLLWSSFSVQHCREHQFCKIVTWLNFILFCCLLFRFWCMHSWILIVQLQCCNYVKINHVRLVIRRGVLVHWQKVYCVT